MLLSSTNKGKINEFRRMFEALGINLVPAEKAGFKLSVEETGNTFEENARLKAMWLYKESHIPVVADDSGLVVDYLGGAPGVYSARYAGDNASDSDRNKKLIGELSNAKGKERSAKFVCHIICIIPKTFLHPNLSKGLELISDSFIETEILPGGDLIISVCGECSGFIAVKPYGGGGFGYDSVFICSDMPGVTFAQLEDIEKDRLSHRGKALRLLAKSLKLIGFNS